MSQTAYVNNVNTSCSEHLRMYMLKLWSEARVRTVTVYAL